MPRPADSNSEVEEAREIFCLFDTDNNGQVLVSTIRDALETVASRCGTSSFDHPNSRISRLLSCLERIPDDKSLSMSEFLKLAMHPGPEDNRTEMQKMFDQFDADGKGYIDKDDLRKIATELGEDLNEEELVEMIDRASNTGRVHLNDFEAMMTRKLFA